MGSRDSSPASPEPPPEPSNATGVEADRGQTWAQLWESGASGLAADTAQVELSGSRPVLCAYRPARCGRCDDGSAVEFWAVTTDTGRQC